MVSPGEAPDLDEFEAEICSWQEHSDMTSDINKSFSVAILEEEVLSKHDSFTSQTG